MVLKEIYESAKDNLLEKIKSPFYGAFIASWCAWNWKIWYVTFFIDSEILLKSKGLIKIDYILSLYPRGNLWEIIIATFYLLFLPLVSSYFVVFQLPKITNKFYSKTVEFRKENIRKNLTAEQELLRFKSKLELQKQDYLGEYQRTITKEREVEKDIKQEEAPEVGWESIYGKENKRHVFLEAMDFLIVCLYKKSGLLLEMPDNNKALNVSYLHTSGLIDFVNNDQNRIKATEKGKYFLKRFLEDK